MADINKSIAEGVAIDIVKNLIREWAEEGDYGAIVHLTDIGLTKHKETHNE